MHVLSQYVHMILWVVGVILSLICFCSTKVLDKARPNSVCSTAALSSQQQIQHVVFEITHHFSWCKVESRQLIRVTSRWALTSLQDIGQVVNHLSLVAKQATDTLVLLELHLFGRMQVRICIQDKRDQPGESQNKERDVSSHTGRKMGCLQTHT